ncbi:hypothetical protein [Luteibacter yeojuensis]|uniref:Uncharacterized protein n=1 Tax=Luteibacter yeojuensis TaxID=345309 RepID=A0A0F3K0Z3_9GAMM|nr:hypothetical protein [Luteibacter yeojuensis]KJV24945.1 hypothetical protein VI08_20085 [Luteibacter yeojuensis]
MNHSVSTKPNATFEPPDVRGAIDDQVEPGQEDVYLVIPLNSLIAVGDEIIVTLASDEAPPRHETLRATNQEGYAATLHLSPDYLRAHDRQAITATYRVTGKATSLPYMFHVGPPKVPLLIDTSPMALEVGESKVRSATGGVPPYVYRSANAAVATVDANARTTGTGPGLTVVTAADAASGSVSYPVDVTQVLVDSLESAPLGDFATLERPFMDILHTYGRTTVASVSHPPYINGRGVMLYAKGPIPPGNAYAVTLSFNRAMKRVRLGYLASASGAVAVEHYANGQSATTPLPGVGPGWSTHVPPSGSAIIRIELRPVAGSDLCIDNIEAEV